MATSSDFSNIRTLEELINMASIMFFNMGQMSEKYYDIFLNPTPMDVQLERYDETGTLVTITIPNRAKDMSPSYSGIGNPNGQQAAKVGSLYVDTESYNLYYKSVGTDSQGWILLWSQDNFSAGTQFLTPTSEAPNLKSLNASNLSSGTTVVERGGTGVSTITGIVKGNGTSPFSVAVDGVDYLGPSSMAGLVCYYPVNMRADDSTVSAIPAGWLRCDGAAYSRTTYSRLFNIIGTTYGTGDGSTTFNVPNLYNHFIRSWDGTSIFNTVQAANVGQHDHEINLVTGSESAHTHTRGTMNITGWVQVGAFNEGGSSGALYPTSNGRKAPNADAGGNNINLDASRSWSGSTSGGSAHKHTVTGSTETNSGDVTETRVLNKMMVPIIKY